MISIKYSISSAKKQDQPLKFADNYKAGEKTLTMADCEAILDDLDWIIHYSVKW